MSTTPQPTKQAMYVAFELSAERWTLGLSNGKKLRRVTIDARDMGAYEKALAEARAKLGVAKDAPVYSCYEAGRDGFWLHRWMEGLGIHNRVVDPSAIQVSRRAKHVKTDRIDVEKLVAMLIRDVGGETGVWRSCRVPTVAEEDDRQPQRELKALQEDRTRVGNQMRSLLIRFGIRVGPGKLPSPPEQLRQRNGDALPPRTQEQLRRSLAHHQLLVEQIREVEADREARMREALQSTPPTPASKHTHGAKTAAKQPTSDAARQQRVAQQVLMLMSLKGIGMTSAWMFITEFFAWRDFHNRREVGAAAGLDGTPFNSGASERDQGISKAGNHRVRDMAIEIAWCWLRFQPNSALSRWYFGRTADGAAKKKCITALARRLLIALWRYLEKGIVPEGAELKPLIALH